MPLKLFVLFAHPDDDSMGMGWLGAEEQNPGLRTQRKFYHPFSLVNGDGKLETDLFEGVYS